MPQGNVNQDTTYTKPAANVGIKYRTTNSGNPLAHNDVDANFELLRLAINGLVSDHTSQATDLTALSSSVGSNDADISALQVSLGNVQVSLGNVRVSLGNVQASVATNASSISTNATNIGSNATNITNIIDGTTAVPIADGAVTEAKIADGAITVSHLSSTVSAQNLMPKTVFVHVGNYYKDNTKYWASDLYNYNTVSDTYGARTTTVIPFTDSEVPGVWGAYHSDSNCAIILEPFATVSAAARYAIHNHGAGLSLAIIVHGHVCWCGTYDVVSHSTFKDLTQWRGVHNLSIVGGRSDDVPNSHYSVFPTNGFSSARIDLGLSDYQTHSANCWIRGPRTFVTGICFTVSTTGFTSPADKKLGLRKAFTLSGAHAYHEWQNVRINGIGNLSSDTFHPLTAKENSSIYYGSGGNQPLEISLTSNCSLFDLSHNCHFLYSNNKTTNPIYFHDVPSNCAMSVSVSSYGSNLQLLHSPISIENNASIPLNNASTFQFYGAHNQVSVARFDPFNTDVSKRGPHLWLPGNQQGFSLAGQGAHNYVAGVDAVHTTSTVPRHSGYPSHTLHGKFHTQANNSSLSKDTLVGDGSKLNFKTLPTTRVGAGGTDQTSAPYSNQ